ncbi:MAG: hypothetical protein EBR10_01285 [Planctomycetes bacterium]|nr:hypothetical protein [Planctomycetota bacterium]
MSENAEIEESAYGWLRGHLAGFIRFDGERVAIRIAPLPDGRFVAPVMVAMLMAGEVVIELPDDGEEDLHLMVSLAQFHDRGEDGRAADRWRAYHGDPPDVNWAFMEVDAAKFRGYFIDGEVFRRPNPLGSEETAICKSLNAGDRDLLRRAIDAAFRIDAADPLVVGADGSGIDVRRQFDVVRLALAEPFTDAVGAEAGLRRLIERETHDRGTRS